MEPSIAGSEPAADLDKRLAEPYAFALLTWPAVLGLQAELPEPWAAPFRVALWLWLAAFQLAAYGGGRGAGFGTAVLLMSGLLAAAAATFPSPWTLAWLPALLTAMHAAQRTRIRPSANTLPELSTDEAGR